MFRMTPLLLRLLPLLLFALVAAGCNNNDEALFGPTPVIPDPTTVVVSGSVTPNGAFTHPFNTFSFGTVQVTLLALEPEPDGPIGLALGTWSGQACQVVLANDQAVVGVVITGSVGSIGSLCVRVYDVGTLSGPTEFQIQIVHP
jgi:hypothetical protein